MRTILAVVVLAALAGSTTACGGGSTNAASRCFDAWNASDNGSHQAEVAGRYDVAEVSRWRAQAAGDEGNVGGPPSFGCSYLFHTARRYVSLSGEWRGRTLRWNAPPTTRGRWSAQQQKATADNATVDADGRLSRGGMTRTTAHDR